MIFSLRVLTLLSFLGMSHGGGNSSVANASRAARNATTSRSHLKDGVIDLTAGTIGESNGQ